MKKKRTRTHLVLSLIIIMSLIFNVTGLTGTTKTASAARNNYYYPTLEVSNFSVSNQTLYLDGYAFDSDYLQGSVNISVFIFKSSYNKIEIARFEAGSYNSTADMAYSCGYFHGFDQEITVDSTKAGTWNLEVQARSFYSDGSTASTSYSTVRSLGTITFGPTATLSVNPNTVTVDSNETSTYISLDINNYGYYTASSDSDWLTIGKDAWKSSASRYLSSSGGYGFYVFTDKNPYKYNRTGTITVVHESDSSVTATITVTQKAMESKLSIDTTRLTADAKGTLSQSYVYVNTDNTGNYNVSTDSNWLTVSIRNNKSSASTGLTDVSSNYFYLFADENTNTINRVATITITHASDSSNSKTITVTQERLNSQLTVEPTDLTADAKGTLSRSYVNVSTNYTGNYNVSTDSDWLTIGTRISASSAGTSLSNISNGYFYVFASENKETTSRTGTITVTHFTNSSESKTITVTQEGSTITPQINVNPTSVTADGEGTLSQSYITVDTKETGTYNITSNVDWLKFYTSSSKDNAVTSLTSISNSKIYLFADSYIGSSDRKGTITITHTKDSSMNKTVTITQAAAAAVISVSRATVNVTVNGETDVNYIDVKANNTSGFSVKTTADWIHFSKTSDGSKSSTLSFEKSDKFYLFVDKTTRSTERTGTITVTGNMGNVSKTISVRQAELIPVLKPSTNTVAIDQNGTFSEGNNSIFISTEKTGGFTATIEDSSWLRLVSSQEAGFSDGFSKRVYEDSAYLYLVANENQTGSIRTGTVTLQHASGSTSVTIEVSQSAEKIEKTFFADTETYDFDNSDRAISDAITITADADVNWTVTSNDSSWLKVTKNKYLSGDIYGSISGNGKSSFYIVVEKNETYEKREEWIEATAPGHDPYRIYVTQAGKEVEIATKPVINQVRFSVTKKTFGIKKTSKVRVQYPDLPDLGIEDDDVKNCASIQYKSSKTKVVSINKQGVIKGKKKGRAKVYITVTLDDDIRRVSRTVKVDVKVGKAKINLKFLKK